MGERRMDEELTHRIIGAAMRVHRALGPGFLESVYQRALCHELRKGGLDVESEKRLKVFHDGIVVGEFDADLSVEGEVLPELKSAETIHPSHSAQLINYLVTTGTDVGLLLNFGGARLDYKKKFRTYKPSHPSKPPSF